VISATCHTDQSIARVYASVKDKPVRVHIVAQRANRYIVAFCIVILRYCTIPGGGGQATLDGAVCASVHLQIRSTEFLAFLESVD